MCHVLQTLQVYFVLTVDLTKSIFTEQDHGSVEHILLTQDDGPLLQVGLLACLRSRLQIK